MIDSEFFDHLISVDYDAASNASNDSHDGRQRKTLHPELRNRLSQIGITNSVTDLLNPPKTKSRRRGELDFRSPYEIMRENAAMNKSPDLKKGKSVKIVVDPAPKTPGRATLHRSQTRAVRGKGTGTGKDFVRAGTVAVGFMDKFQRLLSSSSSSSSSGEGSSSQDSSEVKSEKSESIESVGEKHCFLLHESDMVLPVNIAPFQIILKLWTKLFLLIELLESIAVSFSTAKQFFKTTRHTTAC